MCLYHLADSLNLLMLCLVRDHLEQMLEFIVAIGASCQEVEAFRAWREGGIDKERANGVWFK
jgi:hypothetical protein